MTDDALIHRIRSRCVECGDCLLWPGAMAAGCSPQINYKGKTHPARRILFEAGGGVVPDGGSVVVTCESKRCMRHVEALTAAEFGEKRRGIRLSAAGRANIRNARRARATTPPDVIERIRFGGEPVQDLIDQTGLHFSFIYAIRRGDAWREHAGAHFAGLGARAEPQRRRA